MGYSIVKEDRKGQGMKNDEISRKIEHDPIQPVNREKIINEYEIWKATYPEYMTTNHFFRELLRQASLSNIKNSNTEEEYASINVEIISKELEVSSDVPRENRDYHLQQLQLNKLMVSRLTLPHNNLNDDPF